MTTIELDPQTARTAQARLHSVGARAHLLVGDARSGCPERAPFNRFISTVAARRIPAAWIEQTRPGGVIVTPFHTPLAGYGLLMLTVADDGRSASGAFVGRVAFMWLRAERPGSWPDVQEIPRTRPSEIDPALVAQDIDVQFAVGLRMPDVAHRWAVDSGGRYETLRLRVWDDRGSRAVAFCSGPRTVYEAGPRSLWKEVEEAHLWWTLAGRPACEDFRIAVDAAGSHRVWTGTDPERGWALLDPFTGLRPLPA